MRPISSVSTPRRTRDPEEEFPVLGIVPPPPPTATEVVVDRGRVVVVVVPPTIVEVVEVVEPPTIVVVVVDVVDVVDVEVVEVVVVFNPQVRLDADWLLIVIAVSQKLAPSTKFVGPTQATPMRYAPAGMVALFTIRYIDNCGRPVTRNGDEDPGFTKKAAPETFGSADTNVVPLPVPDAGSGRPNAPKSTDDNVTPEPMK